jgi:predicted molibdopterin-dependent oxidoreductase YjgC
VPALREGERLVRVTVDGVPVEIEEGKTILDAAEKADIRIPTLCYHAQLTPLGSCRLCVVEVEGLEQPVAACTTSVKEGIVVSTQSERLSRLRREALQYILINHPLDCPVCDKAGECRLQDLTYELGIIDQEFAINRVDEVIDHDSPLIYRNYARCVRCGRCVAICSEVQGFRAYDWVENGYEAVVDTVDRGPLSCEFCGQCVRVCPVGALVSKLFKYKKRVWDLEKVATVCPYCGVGCHLELNVSGDKIYRVTTDDSAGTNQGNVCVRGFFGYGFVNNRNRLHTPLLRREGKLVPVSWEEAYEFVVGNLERIKNEFGGQSIAGLASPRLTNEDNYVFQKLLRMAIGTNNVDSAARFGYAKALAGLRESLGVAGITNSFCELEGADTILMVGSDLSAEMPVASLKVIRAARDKGARLIVAHSRETKLDCFTPRRIRYRPGTELSLVLGLSKAVIGGGLINMSFIEKQTKDFDALKSRLDSLSLEEILEGTGVPRQKIESAAFEFASAGQAAIVVGYDVLAHEDAKRIVQALANLALLTGQLGRPSTGIYPVAEKNNMQGLCDMGCQPDFFPGFVPVDESARFETSWGKPLPIAPGKTVDEIFRGIATREIKGLYVVGTDPLTSFPNASGRRDVVKDLELLVVQDVFSTQVAELAHCVFPALTFAEKEGTFTSGERRIQKLERAVKGYRNGKADWEIFCDLSRRLGYPMDYKCAASVSKEIAALVPQYEGLSLEKLRGSGVQWPLKGEGKGTGFFQVNEIRGTFVPIDFPEKRIEPTRQYPFVLVVGLSLYHCGTLSTFADGPNAVRSRSWIDIGEEDAKELGVAEGDAVKVSSERGTLRTVVRVVSQVQKHVLFMPNHFREACVNELTEASNVCLVNLEKS